MKCSLVISNFFEDISSLSHSIVFLYFFALISEAGFLIFPCYSLELCIQMGISFLFSLPFASFLFSAICQASLDYHFAFLHFFFFRMVLITASCTMSWTFVHSSSGTLSTRSNLWICLSLSVYNCRGFDLCHSWMVSGFPYFLHFKSEFVDMEFMIRAIVSSQSCFHWLYRASASFAAKNIINLFWYWPSGDAHM